MTTRTNRIILSLSLVKEANPNVTINSCHSYKFITEEVKSIWDYTLVYKRGVQDRICSKRISGWHCRDISIKVLIILTRYLLHNTIVSTKK